MGVSGELHTLSTLLLTKETLAATEEEHTEEQETFLLLPGIQP